MNKNLFKIFLLSLILFLNSCSSDVTSGIKTLSGFNASKETIIPTPFQGSIVENSLPAVVIGTVVLAGISPAQILTIKLSGTGSQNFSISKSGVISVSNIGNLDYENVKIYNLIAEAIDGTGSTLIAIQVTINITDIVEVTPQILPFPGSVAENSVAGTLVGNLEMLGINTNNLSAITLSGSGNTNFIVSITGSITVAQGASLDFETVRQYTLNVSALDKQGKSLAVSSVNISLTDVSELKPSITSPIQRVKENSIATTVVGKLEIIGVPATNISALTLSGTGNANFVVANDGTISVASGASLDYELVNSYKLTVAILNTVGETIAVSIVNIEIIDVVEITPSIVAFDREVAENSLAGVEVGKLIFSGISLSNLSSFTLLGTGNQNFKVALDGTIFVESGAVLDYELVKSYSLSVKALDKIGETLALATVRIGLVNLVEIPPSMTVPTQSVLENSPAETVIGQITLVSMPTNLLSMRLSGTGNENFLVSKTGEIKVNTGAKLDFEGIKKYTLVVEAVDSTGKTIIATILTILITDVIELLPSISAFIKNVDENITAGNVIGTLTLANMDTSKLLAITLTGTGSEKFDVNTTGTIKVAVGASFDYDTQPVYNFIVKALDKNGNSIAASTVSITLINGGFVSKIKPQLSTFTANIKEQSPTGTLVGNLIIVNQGDSNISSIRLLGTGKDNFSVSKEGVITVSASASLFFATKNIYSLVAIATNGAGDSPSVPVTINLSNVSKTLPILKAFTGSVDENETLGANIGTVDINTTGGVPILAMNLSGVGSSNFTISPTGNILLATAINLDFATVPRYDLLVTATNSEGTSFGVSTTISVVNKAKSKPIIENVTISVVENKGAGSIIGVISLLTDGGGTTIKSFDLNETSTDFNISTSGLISLLPTKNLNAGTKNRYDFNVTATNNDNKTSDPKLLRINITTP